jgi:hypothetical protein
MLWLSRYLSKKVLYLTVINQKGIQSQAMDLLIDVVGKHVMAIGQSLDKQTSLKTVINVKENTSKALRNTPQVTEMRYLSFPC